MHACRLHLVCLCGILVDRQEQYVARMSSPEQSEESNTNQASSGAEERSRRCILCRNHGADEAFRGHSRTCPYRHCTCNLCTISKQRRQIMARKPMRHIIRLYAGNTVVPLALPACSMRPAQVECMTLNL